MKVYSRDAVISLCLKAWEKAESQYFEDYAYNEDAEDELEVISFNKLDFNEWAKDNI